MANFTTTMKLGFGIWYFDSQVKITLSLKCNWRDRTNRHGLPHVNSLSHKGMMDRVVTKVLWGHRGRRQESSLGELEGLL